MANNDCRQTQVTNVSFKGKNRCFIGLKEVYDFLRAKRSGESYNTSIIGRNSEIETILDYVEKGDTPFYRIVGNGGVGKTRLLYEAALKLSDKGIRVLWGLPESMASSNDWFEFLHDNGKTVVIIDNPTDGSLIKLLVERMVMLDRENLKFIFAYRPESEDFLFGHRVRRHFLDNPLQLKPLDQTTTDELCGQRHPSAYQSLFDFIYRYSAGNPGWIWVMLDYFERHDTSLQLLADEITADYLDSAFQIFSDAEKESAEMLLRWLALWGVTEFDFNSSCSIRHFLKENGVSVRTSDLLAKWVETGLVRQVGVETCKYMVTPMVMWEVILSNWLFVRNGVGDDLKYSVSDVGRELVKKITSGNVLFLGRILQSLSHLSLSRLNSNERFSFVKPIFDMFEALLFEESIPANAVKQVVEHISYIGGADLERAIDILTKVFRHKGITTYENDASLRVVFR